MNIELPAGVRSALSSNSLRICPECKGHETDYRCEKCNSWRVVDGNGSALTDGNTAPEHYHSEIVSILKKRALV